MNKRMPLAVEGGARVRKAAFPPRALFDRECLTQVSKVFEESWARDTDFGYQEQFETLYTQAFCDYQGGGFADVVCTGTAAIFVAIAALQLPPSSHVLVSSITDPGTISAIILNRLVPGLVDVEWESYNIGIDQFSSRISDRVKAAVVVHASGKAAPIREIVGVAREKGIAVIEDCSQAHGAAIGNQKIGTFGDLAAFSTMYRKGHATGGSGGVVFTQNPHYHRLARAYADRGKPYWQAGYDEKDPGGYLFPALNLNRDEISCALGLATLAKLQATIEKRLAFLRNLRESISGASKACRPTPVDSGDSPFFYPILVNQTSLHCSKQFFAEAIRAEGIPINPVYRYVVSDWPWVKPYLSDDFSCPNAIAMRDNSFNLLFNEHCGDQEVSDVTEAILKVERVYYG